MSFKRIVVDQSKPFPTNKLRLDKDDGPQYPLLEFKGFGSRNTKDIVATEKNLPRKVEHKQSKWDALVASTFGFLWLLASWPISIFITEEKDERQFDHRHLLSALKFNKWVVAPVAFYIRKYLGDVTDLLSESSVMTLSGLYIHSIDGQDNARMEDYYVIRKIMEEDNIPIIKSNVVRLMEIAGVFKKYPSINQKSVIGTIRNQILKPKIQSSRVFNTSENEVKTWVFEHQYFGMNNVSTVDGVPTYHKILDSRFTYRYANDILRWCFKHWLKRERIRVIASSKAECENTIMDERQEMIDTIKDVLDNTVNWYISWVERRFHSVGMKITLPKLDMSELPLDLWFIPQIDGEDEDKAIKAKF